MPFIQREKGAIVGAYANPQPGYAEEEIHEDSAELLAFLNPPVASVSARQFKLQLLASGLLDQVDAWIASQSKAVQIAYESSSTFVRSEPMMAAGFAAMGFSAEQIDGFFQDASKL